MRTKKKLALWLVFALLLTIVCPARAAEAAGKNPITKLGIAELPKDNTILVGDSFNFDPEIQATKQKGKSTGVVYWEVNQRTNTAGVSSCRWGDVYPIYAGSFEIRAVAFASTKDMNAWTKARNANGYIEDAAAGKKYVTAYSEWVTIKVISDKEGYAVARSQRQLNKALKNKKVTDIHIITDKERTFTIKSANYKKKTLTVKVPNSDVINAGRFAQINVEEIKSSTFFEKAIGNRFHISAPKASLHIEEKAKILNLEYAPTNKDATINIVGNGGRINNISIAAPGEVKISGTSNTKIPVTVEKTAAGAKIDTAMNVVINASAQVELTTTKEAADVVVNILEAIVAVIKGDTKKIVVNVDKEAEGAVIRSEATLEVKAEASVSVELAEGAEGTTVTKEENVAVSVVTDEKMKEDVVIKDSEGNETVVKPGEETKVEAVPTVEPTQAPITTPGGGSSNVPTSPATPTSTPSGTPSVTPTGTPSETPSETPSATPTGAPSGTPSGVVITLNSTTVAPEKGSVAVNNNAGTVTVKTVSGSSVTVTLSCDVTVNGTATSDYTYEWSNGSATSKNGEVTVSGDKEEVWYVVVIIDGKEYSSKENHPTTPTGTPTVSPSATPTAGPSATPTASPSATPTASPSATPTASPSATPTASPSATPTAGPSVTPTTSPSATPTVSPSATPTAGPSATPTVIITLNVETPTPAAESGSASVENGTVRVTAVSGSSITVTLSCSVTVDGTTSEDYTCSWQKETNSENKNNTTEDNKTHEVTVDNTSGKEENLIEIWYYGYH